MRTPGELRCRNRTDHRAQQCQAQDVGSARVPAAGYPGDGGTLIMEIYPPTDSQLDNEDILLRSYERQLGRKDDTDKVRMELIPPELLMATATVLTFGAGKYGDRNWEQGISWGRVFGALMRHLWAWWGGKGPTTKSFLFGDLDSETGYSHLWHAACCIAFLISYEERSMVAFDDRSPKKTVPF